MSRYRKDLAPDAKRALDEIPTDEQLVLRRAIRALPDGNVRRLESNPRLYRLRVEGSSWRVIFEVDRRRKRIAVLLVARREVIYERIPRR